MEQKNGYKCATCGEEKGIGESYWRVRIVDMSGSERYIPTCSLECATKIQQEYLEIHERMVDSIRCQQFQHMKWSK